ncbi:MAG: DUF2157 domain-containing protein [Elusimicrobia bacterium]|nr:DUF2157 domain-containing protein [Elusimicrobiota bacterium]
MCILYTFIQLLIYGFIIYIIVRAVSGGRRRFLKRLQREIIVWEKSSIISSEQVNSILQIYDLKRPDIGRKMDTVKVITLTGSIFLGLGVIFLVGSNWHEIPDYIRTIMLLGVTIVTLFLGYFYSYEKDGYPNLGKNLLLLAAILWGPCIALICQIYHISSDNWTIMLLWAFPILPISYFFDNKYVFILATVLCCIWNFLYSASNNAANYYYPLIAFTLLLPAICNSKIASFINISGLVLASFYCCFFKYEWLSLFISIGLLVYYLVNQDKKEFLYASSISFIAWQITYFTIRDTQPNFYFLVPLTVLFYFTYKDKLKFSLVINILNIIIWFHYMLYPYSKILNDKYVFLTAFVMQTLIGLLLYIIGIIHRNKNNPLEDVYRMLGYLTTFGCIYLLSFKKLLLSGSKINFNLYYVVCLVLTAVSAILILGQFKKGLFTSKSSKIELTGMAIVLAGSVFMLTGYDYILVNTVIANFILVTFAAVNIFYGVEKQNPAIFNSGIIIFVFFIITRYVDIFWELKEKSWFFILGGLFMIFGGIYLEKQRKRVIEKMKT